MFDWKLKNKSEYRVSFDNALSSVLVFVLFFVNTFSALAFFPFTPTPDFIANAALTENNQINETVALLVDSSIKNISDDFDGLSNQYSDVDRNTLYDRINRYAGDIKNNYPATDVKIIEIGEDLSSYDISLILNNLYQNSNLLGVVLFGDIEMPRVLVDGNETLSVVPYTDFIDKAFVYDEGLEIFVKNDSSNFFHAEVWHGILRAYADDNESLKNLATYLDRNHLYYIGNSDFSDYEKNFFYADFVKEAESIDETSYQNYLNYLSTFEDQAFNRYTKEFAVALNGEVIDSLDLPLTLEGADFFDSASDNYDTSPDLQMKYIISELLPPYYKILSKYISDVNDYVSSTGRYSASDLSTVVSDISIKDEYAKQYLKNLTLKFEDRISGMLEDRADSLNVVDYSSLEVFYNNASVGKKYIRFNYLNEILDKYFVNGVALENLKSVIDVSDIAGSTKMVSVNSKDAVMSGFSYPSTGVNTKMGVYNDKIGAVVESFDQNFLYSAADKYKNPIASKLQKNDVIVSVNGEKLSSTLTYEKAISDMFNKTNQVLNILNNRNIDDKEAYLIDSFGAEFFAKIEKPPLSSINANNARQIMSNFSVEFYRNGTLHKENFTFTIQNDGLSSREDPQGTPSIAILYSSLGFENGVLDFEQNSDGAIFTLYDTRKKSSNVSDLNGYSNAGYDLSGGCSQNNTGEYDDRCFGVVAQIPVRDMSGGKVLSADEALKIDDIDLWHFDSLYFGLPTISNNLMNDSNPFKFVLDPATFNFLSTIDESDDLYGQFLKRIGEFIYDRNNGSNVQKSAATVWDPVNNLTSADIVLYENPAYKITLKDFTDRYGIFDGIDNDGDGISDFEYRDLDNNGSKETKWYDLDEASLDYALDSTNLKRINRLLFSKFQEIVLPKEVTDFNVDIKLKVSPNILSSLPAIVVHNEPTDETIAAQLKSFGTLDLPIDDPRYVAILKNSELERFDFVNLFELSNVADLSSQLLDFSKTISEMDGVLTADAVFDSNFSSLINAEKDSLSEVLDWMNMDINEKHAFVLAENLAKKNEVSYLRIDGDKNSFDIDFNKDLDVETDPNFNSLYSYEASPLDEVQDLEALDEMIGKNKKDGIDAVWLDDFILEIDKFVNSFTMDPEFVDCCVFAEDVRNNDGVLGADSTSNVNSELTISSERSVLSSNGDTTNVVVTMSDSSEIVNLEISSGENIIEVAGDKSKLLVDGRAQFEISSVGETGKVKMIAVSSSGKTSNNLDLIFSDKYLDVETYTIASELSDAEVDEIVGGFEVLGVDLGAGAEGVAESGTGSVVDVGAGVDVVAGADVGDVSVGNGDLIDGGGSDSGGSGVGDSGAASGASGTVDGTISDGTSDGTSENSSSSGSDILNNNGTGNLDLGNDANINPDLVSGVGNINTDVGNSNINNTEIDLGVSGSDLNNENNFVDPNSFGEIIGNNNDLDTFTAQDIKPVCESDSQIDCDEKWQDYYFNNNYYEKYIGILSEILKNLCDSNSQNDCEVLWQDYYFDNEYFEKYIGILSPILNTQNMLAEVLNDSVLISYISPSENPFINYSNDLAVNTFIENNNSIVADDQSLIKVLVRSNDENFDGKISLKIVDPLQNEMIKFENGNTSDAKNGIAEFYLRAGKKSGEVLLEAFSDDTNIVNKEFKILLLAGKASDINISSNTDSLIKNSSAEINVKVFDKYENIVNNDFSEIMIFADDGINASIENSANFDGIYNFNVDALEKTGEYYVYSVLKTNALTAKINVHKDFDIEDVKLGKYYDEFLIVKKIKINVLDDIQIKANINDLSFNLEILDPENNPINYTGDINVSVEKTYKNGIEDNGNGIYTFVSDGISQNIPVKISLPNIKDETIYLDVKNSVPSKLSIKNEITSVSSDSNQAITLNVDILDEFGNLVKDDNQTLVYFEISDSTKSFIQILSNNPVRSKLGKVELKFIPNGMSGTVNITAKANSLESDFISIDIKKKLSKSDLEKFNLNSLYLNLFGNDFGNLEEKNNIAETLLYSGNAMALSFNSESIENGEGFMNDNKSILNFSAGLSVGQSTMYDANLSTLNYGDPMIRLSKSQSSLSSFDSTIGKKILSGDKEIFDVLSIKFDADNYEDLLVVYEDGLVSVLKNENSNNRFKDLGYILNISQGINNVVPIDINGDGLSDLIVNTNESCGVNDKDKLSLYENLGGYFEKRDFELNLDNEIYEMKAEDLNVDGCEDLVVSDSAGFIKTYYNNSCESVGPNYVDKFNFGFSLTENLEINDTLRVSFDGMSVKDENLNYVKISQNEKENETKVLGIDSGDIFNMDELQKSKEIYLYEISNLNDNLDVHRLVYDVNGENLSKGDVIKFEIEINNNESLRKTNLTVSDLFNPGMKLDITSLKCEIGDCANLEFKKAGINLRDYVISGFNLRGNSGVKISYEMEVLDMPKLNFDIGNGFDDLSSDADAYPDIYIRSPYNDSNLKNYIYSEGKINNYVDYKIKNIEVQPNPNQNNSINSPITDPSKLLDELNKDENFDGISDSWSGISKNSEGDLLDSLTEDISSTLADFTCNGAGCLPSPFNYALFAPDANKGDPGLAALSIHYAGLIVYPTFFTPSSADPTSFFRIYLSPTATLGLGMAICTGPGVPPSGTAPCYAFSLPVEALGICPDISGFIDGLISEAKDAFVNVDTGMATVVNTGSTDLPDDAISGSFNYAEPEIPVQASGSVNIRVPGFPSVITDWLDNQTNEIFTKLLDLPDIYFIYPDISTMFSDSMTKGTDYSNINNMNDLLRAINSIPLIKLDTKDVIIKIPALSQAEIEKYKRQVELWIEYEKNELKKIEQYWQCDISDVRKNFCDIVTLQLGDLILNMELMLDKLDALLNLPRDILNIRSLETKYANQIICYLDAITEYTSGYIKRQTNIIDSWLKAIEDVIRTFKDWKIILDLSAEYQASCDTCKTDRFGRIGLLLSFLAVIPDPPVLEFPKWPDIYFDMSQIETGVEILWPNIKFKPEKVELPDLPVINLPLTLPDEFNINISIEGLGLDALYEFKLPDWIENFPALGLEGLIDFPDLPTLALPKLPDLPRPPKIPGIPKFVKDFALNIQKLMKLLCVIKKGLVPVPEGFLASEIETLTNPSVMATLPFTKNLAVNMPAIEYEFLREIHINAKIKFAIDTEFIYWAVKNGADKYNYLVEGFVRKINDKLDISLQALVDEYINSYIKKASSYATSNINEAIKSADTEIQKALDEQTNNLNKNINQTESSIQGELNNATDYIDNTVQDVIGETTDEVVINSFKNEIEKYTESLKIYESELSDIEQVSEYKLIATSVPLSADDPILNRDISEIKNKILTEDYVATGNVGYLRDVRNSLISYVEDDSRMDVDFDSLAKIDVLTSQNNLIASISNDSFNDDENINTEKSKMFGDVLNEIKNDFDFENNVSENLIAEVDTSGASASNSANSASPINLPKGIYVSYNGSASNIISYVRELDDSTVIVYSDVDLDDDEDVIYSMNADLYLKENYENKADEFETGTIQTISNASSLIKSDAVSGLENVYENNGIAKIKFNKVKDATSYIIDVRNNFYIGGSFEKIEILAKDYDGETINYELKLENKDYYVFVTAIFENGESSLVSYPLIISPQICYDKDLPLPVLNKVNYDLYIFDTLDIDAGLSRDLSSEIKEYYIESVDSGKLIWSDKNTGIDEDGDGNSSNDKSNPNFKIGPYTSPDDLGEHEFTLNVVDENGNSSQEKFIVNVISPNIVLDENASAVSVSGEVLDVDQNIPFSLIRTRYIDRIYYGKLVKTPRVEKVLTDLAFDNGKYYTNEMGEYLINDFVNEDVINVENSDGDVIAEINKNTGNINILDNSYDLNVEFSKALSDRVKIQILDKNGNNLGEVYFVSDANESIDVYQNISFESGEYSDFSGVNINDLDVNDLFKVVNFSAFDANYPNGAGLVFSENGQERYVLIVDSSGNVLKFDDRLSIEVKKNNFKEDPVIFNVMWSGKPIIEIYIAFNKYTEFISPDKILNGVSNLPNISLLYSSLSDDKFKDVKDSLKPLLNVLYKNGIILGMETENGIIINPDENVSRAEAIRSLLKMLCIIPSDVAYLPYSSNESSGGYSDVLYSANDPAWYYPFVKEADLRGLIDGYKGETDINTGLHPFKPLEIINLAEILKILLESLEMLNKIDLSNVKEVPPSWYGDYLKVALDLSSVAKGSENVLNKFLVTSDEISNPDKEIDREDLIMLSSRVLDIYNCFEIDKNSNGVSDYCEAKWDIQDINADSDDDGLTNKEECEYGLNPYKADTDGGGVNDFDEVNLGTDPGYKNDDLIDSDFDKLPDYYEINVYGTDPFNPDTDYGGVNDYDEVNGNLNPLDKTDDHDSSIISNETLEEGVYIIPSECNSCPCVSTFISSNDLEISDEIFTIISNFTEDYIFSKSNVVTIKND